MAFRPIAGYEDRYQVSDTGEVLSLVTGRLLSLYRGDKYVKVRLKRDGEGSTKNVHQLVAAAFLGPCPEGMEVCHNNSDPHDNRVENLRYDTHVANCEDRTRVGHITPRRTHCKRGHELTDDNLRIEKRSRGGVLRLCRTCAVARDKAAYWRKKEAA